MGITFVSSDIWGLKEYCRLKQKEYEDKGLHCHRVCVSDSLLRKGHEIDAECTESKRAKYSHDPDTYIRNVVFIRQHFTNLTLPKCMLNAHAMKNRLDQPTYETRQNDRLFQTVITYADKKYASSYWEKNKRYAEQGAALACILSLGLVNEEELINSGILTSWTNI